MAVTMLVRHTLPHRLSSTFIPLSMRFQIIFPPFLPVSLHVFQRRHLMGVCRGTQRERLGSLLEQVYVGGLCSRLRCASPSAEGGSDESRRDRGFVIGDRSRRRR
jgi:hypothetical protein